MTPALDAARTEIRALLSRYMYENRHADVTLDDVMAVIAAHTEAALAEKEAAYQHEHWKHVQNAEEVDRLRAALAEREKEPASAISPPGSMRMGDMYDD